MVDGVCNSQNSRLVYELICTCHVGPTRFDNTNIIPASLRVFIIVYLKTEMFPAICDPSRKKTKTAQYIYIGIYTCKSCSYRGKAVQKGKKSVQVCWRNAWLINTTAARLAFGRFPQSRASENDEEEEEVISYGTIVGVE